MATVAEQQQKWLLKKFHTLCTRAGLNTDEKAALISGFGVESSRDMTNAELAEACTKLEQIADPELAKLDRARKRAMGAIAGWLSSIGREATGDYIKVIACRATGYKSFNKIPRERLMNLYNNFLKQRRDAEAVNKLCAEVIIDGFGSANLN